MAISLVPLLIVGTILVISAQNKLRYEAVTQQKLIATNSAYHVDTFLSDKVNSLIFQSQTASIRQFDMTDASLNLAALVKQDRDIDRVALLDKNGMEKVVLNQTGLLPVRSYVSEAGSDAFKATTFLAGKEYISSVAYSSSNEPHVTIAVPLIRFTSQQDLTNLSTAQFGTYRTPDDIQGVLVADYNLSDLWQSVLSTHAEGNGYAYVVDGTGSLIAHPDSSFLRTHHDLSHVHEVEDFLTNDAAVHTSLSEKGVSVLASYQATTRTNWGVIVEEPTSSVFASVYSFYRLGGAILLAVAIIAVAASLIFRHQLLGPIQLVAAGALRIGRGDLKYKIPTHTDDELGDLARSFNGMGESLQALVHGLQEKNESLSTEQRKLESILHSISDGVIAINDNQDIVSINDPAAELVGKKPDEIVGSPLSRSFVLMRGEQPFVFASDKPGVYHYEGLMLPQGDRLRYLDLVIVVQEKDDDDISAIITVHDLTQGRELEAMKLDFVAIAAHELRTPLTVIRGYLDLINTSPDLSHLTVLNIEYLQRALIGVTQLGNLINNILNVSRIERGNLHVKVSRVDIASLTNRLVEEESVSALVKQQHLKYQGPINKVYVAGDESAVGEVITNLVSNAIKYTPEAGHIDVKLMQTGNYIRVEVHDDGKGIPDKAKDHLFTKFYRVENSMTASNRGTGLGLFISKSIIEMHHGQIGVDSQEGKGSTFYFTLPIYRESEHGAISSDTKEIQRIHGWFPKNSNR